MDGPDPKDLEPVKKEHGEGFDEKYDFLYELQWEGLLNSINSYIKETNAKCLNLKRQGLCNEHLESLLTALKGTQVTELDLSFNNFKTGLKDVAKLFTETEITKLSFKCCNLESEDAVFLMKVLKDTKISDLDISHNGVEFDEHASQDFVSFLRKSHLTALNFECCYIQNEIGSRLFVQALLHTSITNLKLSSGCVDDDSLAYLLLNLPSASIIELSIFKEDEIPYEVLRALATGLKNSKLKKLDFDVMLDDESVNELNQSMNLLMESVSLSGIKDFIFHAINGSDSNSVIGWNSLSHYLRSSRIENLSLGGELVERILMSSPPLLINEFVTTLSINWCLDGKLGSILIRSLKNSRLIKLNLFRNNLQSDSIFALAEVVKDTVLEDVNLSYNKLPLAAIHALGEGLIGSKVTCIDLSCVLEQSTGNATLSEFIEKLKNTSVKVVKLSGNHIDCSGAKSISVNLAGSKFTHLYLGNNDIGDGVVYLAAQLKKTSITHLILSGNKITDIGAEVLANSLKESQLTELNLNRNLISSSGALALARSLKKSSLISLRLKENKIGIGGFEALAAHAKNTLLINFKGRGYQQKKYVFTGDRMVKKVIFKNKISAHKIIKFFNNVKPETDAQNFCFDHGLNKEDMSKFLEECHEFHRMILELPAVISVLSQESQFSRSELSVLLFEHFPKQLASFIENEVAPSYAKFFKDFKKSLRKRTPESNEIYSLLKLKKHKK